jgi:hypothetical protein
MDPAPIITIAKDNFEGVSNPRSAVNGSINAAVVVMAMQNRSFLFY